MTLAKQPNPRLKTDVENARLEGSLYSSPLSRIAVIRTRAQMKQYADRFLESTYQADEPVSVGICRPDAEPTWELPVPLTLFARAQAISDGYNLHILHLIDPYTRTRLNVDQCRTLADELVFVAEVVNDELLRHHLLALLSLVERCVRKSGREELVIEGP
jgi:hypothetical protein